MSCSYKIPSSVLVVIYTIQGDVLLLHRADGAGFWQSVSGSLDHSDEPWDQAAAREVLEETGIDAHGPGAELQDWALENVYDIYPQWRHSYAPGVVFNTERVFGLRLSHRPAVVLSLREHTDCVWLPWRDAAWQCSSASNAEAVLHVPHWLGLRRHWRQALTLA